MAFLTKQTEYFKTTNQPFVANAGTRAYMVDGVASGFQTDTSILTVDTFAPTQGDNWEFMVKLKTGSSVSGTQQFIGGVITSTGAGLEAAVYEGKFRWWLGSTTSYNIADAVTGTYVVQPNTDYWVRIRFDGEKYTFEYSTDGEYFNQELQAVSSLVINPEQKSFGCDAAQNSSPFLGSIDFNETYVKLNDEIWWNIEKPYIADGYWIIDGIVTGFSTSRYVQVPWSFNAAVGGSNWEAVGKFRLNSGGVVNPIYGGVAGTCIMDIFVNESLKFGLNLSSTGSSYNITTGVFGATTLELGKDYWVKVVFDGTKYVLSYSEDGVAFYDEIVVESDLKLELTYDRLCIGFRDGKYLMGSIDLKESYIKIADSYWWYGVDTVDVNPKSVTDYGTTKYYKDEEVTKYWKWGEEPNATVVGAFGIVDNGDARNFTATNYITMPQDFRPNDKPWEYVIKMTVKSPATYQFISGVDYNGFGLSINGYRSDTRRIRMYLSSVSGSWGMGAFDGKTTMVEGVTYWLKVLFTGTQYKLLLAYNPDFEDARTEISVDSTALISPIVSMRLGALGSGSGATLPFMGTIHLNETYYNVDGERVWDGSSHDRVGNWIEGGVVGQYTGGSYLKYDAIPLPFSTSESVEIVMRAKSNTLGGNQAIVGNMTDAGSGGGVVIRTVGSNRLYMWLSTTVGSWSVTQWDSGVDISADWRLFKFVFSPTLVTFYWSDDEGETWETGNTLSLNGIANQTFQVGGAANNIPWLGLVDFNNSYINIDGNLWWHGTKAVQGDSQDFDYSTQEEEPVEVPAGEPYDYSLHYPSTQYTYSQARNNGFEFTRRKSFYYAYTDDLETLRTGDWGTLTSDGLASGFSATDECLTLPQRVPMWNADTWEMVFKFKYVASTESFQSIWDAGGNYSLGLQIDPTGHVHLRGGNATKSNLFDIVTTTAMVDGNIYYAKADFTGTAYNVYVSETDEFGEPEASFETTTKITERGYKNRLGAHQGDILQYIFKGVLHLPESYINVDGNRFWDWKTSIVPDGHIMNNLLWGKDGIVSTDNVANNNLLLPELAQPTGINWEVQVKITTGSDVSTEQCLIGDWIAYDGFLLQIRANKIEFYASSNGTSWDISSEKLSTNTILANTTYYVKLSYDGVKYSIDVSTDGAIYDNYITVETDKLMYKGRYVACARYGGDRAFSVQFKGTMDLNESYMIIGDDIVWSGMKTLINPTYYFGMTGSWIKKDVDNGHIIGGRSGSGTYMRASRPVFSSYDKDIEVCMKVMMDANPVSAGEIQYVMAPNYSTFIWGFNTDGRVCRYNNSAWVYGTTYYMPGEWIWLKVKWDGANYYTYTLKDDGYTKDTLPDVSEWEVTGTFANTTNIFSGYNLFLGWDDNKAARYFRGYIDYSESYVKVDGKEIWTGTAIREIPETEVTVDIEYYKEIRHQVDTLTYACYSTNDRYVYAKAPVGGYDTVYCYRGNDMSVQTTDASLLASSGYTFTGLTDDLATFNLVGDYSLPRYPDGDIYRTAISIETVPGTPDDYTYTKISENFGFTETRRVAAPLINVAATKRYYFRVILETDTPGEYSFTIPEDSEYTRVTIVGGGGACALRGVYDDRGYGWGGGSAGAYDGEFALTPGEYTATVASANNNTKSQGGNTNTLNPNDMTTHDSWIDGVVRIGGGGCGHYRPNYVGDAGASATFEMAPQNSRLNTVGRVGKYGSGGKGSSPAAYCAGGDSVYNGYGKGQGGYASEYANGRRWVNGTGGYLKVVSASLSPEGGYDYFEDILKG